MTLVATGTRAWAEGNSWHCPKTCSFSSILGCSWGQSFTVGSLLRNLANMTDNLTRLLSWEIKCLNVLLKFKKWNISKTFWKAFFISWWRLGGIFFHDYFFENRIILNWTAALNVPWNWLWTCIEPFPFYAMSMDLIEMEFRSNSIFYAKPYKCKPWFLT